MQYTVIGNNVLFEFFPPSCSSHATQSALFMKTMASFGRTVSSVMWSLFWVR